MNWLKEYKSSLKNQTIEEPLDLVFYRPLGFLVAKFFSSFRVTPNQITFVSMLFGISAGLLYSFGRASTTLIAGILFLFANIFDCADGQLARMKKIYSDLGRLIDGFADYMTGLAVLLGIGIGYSNQFYKPVIWWGLIIIAAIFNILQAVLLDAHRNSYLSLVTGNNVSLQDEYNSFSTKLKFETLTGFERLVIRLYLLYLRVMIKTTPNLMKEQYDVYIRNTLLENYPPIMRLWTYTGTSTRISIAIIASMFNRPDLYLFVIIFPLNLYVLFLTIIQSRFDLKYREGL
jgi:phosphatidylglycerophosphate synthase